MKNIDILKNQPSNSKNSERTEGITIRSCSFTGHRQIKPEHEKIVMDRLSRAIQYAYSNGCRVFYSGGAIGFDTIAAREVLRFSISHPDVSLRLLLPCTNQDSHWSRRQKSAYSYLLKHAELIEYISDEYTPTCMRERNTRLAELGDILVAYLYRAGSGTAQTVRIAAKMGKKVYNIAPISGASE